MADGPIQDILNQAPDPNADQQGAVTSVVPEVLREQQKQADKKGGGITVVIPHDSGDGGGSSGSGSSGGGTTTTTTTAAPADPDAPLISAAKQVYMKLWGQAPPSNYVEQAIHSGMNIWEFEDKERNKPAFRKTKTYRTEADALAALLHQMGIA
jgi:hypothetical protein